jgi:CRP/FNR family transcriptional regulator, cyclic AMP receptor protein
MLGFRKEGTVVASPLIHALSSSTMLSGLPPEILAQLSALARRRNYRRGEIIFHQGDPGDTLHIIESGTVKVVVDAESGNEAVLTTLGAGKCFGELALMDGEPRSATIEALENVDTIVLRRADFMDVVRTNQAAFDALLATVAQLIRRLTDDVATLSFLDLEGRLAKKLLELGDAYGRPVDGGLEIRVPFTQEELAAMIGATRTSVNKSLGWYEDQGAIQRRRRRIIITDPDKLQRRIT